MATITETPVVGGVTTSAAKVGIRVDTDGAKVKVEYSTNKYFTSYDTSSEVEADIDDDLCVIVPLSGLSADTVYYYRIRVDGVIRTAYPIQKFKTFPSSSQEFKFAVFADVANVDRGAAAYDSANDDGILFACKIGDFDHGDPTTLAAMREMHRDMKNKGLLHGADFSKYITSKFGLVSIWDDHDYGGQDEDRHFAGKANALQAWTEHWPSYDLANGSAGLWHSFVCGDAEIFVLDLRSQRDAGTDTDNSDKSMLDGGLITDDQKDWLKDGLSNSTAKWKIILTSVTTNSDARSTSTDPWHSYGTEAAEMKDYIDDEEITGVVMISGDLHTGGGIDDGTNSEWGQPEMTVPHVNLVGGNTANKGTWSEGCDDGARGYGLVTVSATSLKLEACAPNGSVRRSLTLT